MGKFNLEKLSYLQSLKPENAFPENLISQKRKINADKSGLIKNRKEDGVIFHVLGEKENRFRCYKEEIWVI